MEYSLYFIRKRKLRWLYRKEERNQFETLRELFSKEVRIFYDKAITCHDGKWIMFNIPDRSKI